MATQTLSNLKINIWNKTGSPTGGDIQLYGGAAGNILFDQTNSKIYVNGSPYCGKNWTNDISKIQNFLTGTTSTIGGTVNASGVYSIELTGFDPSGPNKVNKNVKDYVNTLVTKVTALETKTAGVTGAYFVNSINTATSALQCGDISYISHMTGDVVLNGTNLLVGNLVGNSQTGTPSRYHDSTISGAIHNIADELDMLQSGQTGLSYVLDTIRDIKTELEWTDSTSPDDPSPAITIIDNLSRLKTNSVEYKGVKGANFGGPSGPTIWLQYLTTDIPTNEAPISLQSAINNIAAVVNNNASKQAYFIEQYQPSYIYSTTYFNSLDLNWYDTNANTYAYFNTQLNLKLNFDDSTYSTTIVRGYEYEPAFKISNIYNIPSAYEVHNHVINMSRTYGSTGIPYQITDLSYVNPIWGPSIHEGYDSTANTYTTYNEGIVQSIVQYEGKLRVSTQFNNEISQRINNAKSDAYSYVSNQIKQVITWTELT